MSTAVRRRREHRREEILRAAWGLARSEGVAQLSLRELAGVVGLRAPSLYEYFNSKDAIYDAMFAEGWTQLRAVMAALPATGDARADLIAGTEAFLNFCAEDLARYQLMFTRTVPGWEPSAEAYTASVRTYQQMIEMMATAGVTDSADVDLWTAITSGLAAQQAANDPGGDRYRRLTPAAVEMYLTHLAVRRDPT